MNLKSLLGALRFSRDLLNAGIKLRMYHTPFEEKGLFSREVSTDYNVISDQPWLYINHPDDESLSFNIHNIEFGKDNQGDAALLHMAAQKSERFRFNGFVNSFGSNSNRIRGYLEVPSKHYKLGIVANFGRIEKLVTQDEMHRLIDETIEPVRPFFYAFIHCIHSRRIPVDKI